MIALDGSFLGHVYALCRCDFGAVMNIAAGRVDRDLMRAPREESSLVDSLRLVLAGNCEASRRLLRLLTSCPSCFLCVLSHDDSE